jgi:hypothetical protein
MTTQMDLYFYLFNKGPTIFQTDNTDVFNATLHSSNTTLKPFEDPRHKKHAVQWMNVRHEGQAENPDQSRQEN